MSRHPDGFWKIMVQAGYVFRVRPNVALTVATDSIFRASGKFDRAAVDAVCVDWAAPIKRGRTNTVFDWVNKATALGLQMFIVGSRHNLVNSPELQRMSVTLIEKPADESFIDEFLLMEWLSKELDKIYAPLYLADGGFLAVEEGMSASDASYRSRLQELANSLASIRVENTHCSRASGARRQYFPVISAFGVRRCG